MRGKKIWSRTGRAVIALLLAAIVMLEPAANHMTVYATEVTNPETEPEDTTEPGDGEEDEDNTENKDEEEGEEGETNPENPDEEEGGNDSGDSENNNGDENNGDEEGGNGDGADLEENGGDVSGEEDGEDSTGGDGGEEDDSNEDGTEESVEGNETDEESEDADEETQDEEEAVDLDEVLLQSNGQRSMTEEEFESLKRELEDWAERTGRMPSGYMDADFEVEPLSEPVQASDDSFGAAKEPVSIPMSYDARETGAVSGVKNQASWGTCWAFSAVASAESAYKRIYGGQEADLSETHLVNFFYNGNAGIDLEGPDGGLSGDRTTTVGDTPVNRGGNSVFTTFAMANWTGIADENTGDGALKYPEPEETRYNDSLYIDSALAYEDALHLENAYWIHISDRESVKEAIIEYGTVGVSYFYDAGYDSDAYKEYVNSDYDGSAVYFNPDTKEMNHVVAIVGWDDTFSRENFRYTYYNGVAEEYGYGKVTLPKNDGAWLMKNSWGEQAGDGGYFWMSYEDISLLTEGNVFAFDFGTGDNYDHNYQYDGANGTRSYSGSQVTAAAVYTAYGEENSFQEIEAVGIGVASSSTDYTVSIYTNLEDVNNPDSGVLAATSSGRTSFPGFYTIEIGDTVVVEAGETFAVVVTARKSGGASLFVDTTYQNGSWIKFDASTENDRTYYKSGQTWYDAGKKKNYTFRIKAYTNDSGAPEVRAEDKVLSMDMLEEILPEEYTGEAIQPKPVLVFSGEKLTAGVDYSVAYSNNIVASDENNKAQIIITGEGEYAGSALTAEFEIKPKAIDEAMVLTAECVYDGTVHDDIVTVTHNENSMAEGTDYVVQYSKTPQNAGNYSVTVSGQGNYTGSIKRSFTVEKLNLENLDAAEILLEDTKEYTGQVLKPGVQLLYNGNTIPAANYTVKYQNNKNAGTAKVTVTGKTNCTKSAVKEFQISPKPIAAENVTVSVKEGTYTGKEVMPTVTVKDGKTTLKKNRDYTLTYENNIDAAGEAKVIVKGAGNYAGEKAEEFTIKPQKIASKKITVSLSGAYDGQPSACSVYVNKNKLDSGEYELAIKNAGQEEEVKEDSLELGQKYDITITLKNNYSGSATVKNAACVRTVESLDIRLTQGNSYAYTGSAQKPAVAVEDGNGTALKKGTDYNIIYANNTNAGQASVSVTGKGKYTGTVVLPFTINPKEVTAEELKISIPAQNYTGAEIKPAVTVKCGNKKLRAGTDYRLGNYTNNKNVSYNGQQEPVAGAGIEILLMNYTVKQDSGADSVNTLTGTFMIKPVKISSVKVGTCYYAGGSKVEPAVTVKAGKFELTPEDYDISYSGNEQVGKKAKVTVTAKQNSNYTGGKTVAFSITKESLSKAAAEGIAERTYTGSAITIPEAEIKVKSSGGVEINPDNYTVKYKNNTKVGTASITITAKADSIYRGSKTIKFKINKADIADVIGDVSLESRIYTGKKQTFTTKEVQNAVRAAMGYVPSCKITYSDNVDAGTAKVILTGTGSYTGTKEIPFTISPYGIKNVSVRLKNSKLSYNNGNPVCAEIEKITYGRRLALRQGKDYTVSFINSKGKGAAYIRITGRGNYTGMKSVYYSIQ